MFDLFLFPLVNQAYKTNISFLDLYGVEIITPQVQTSKQSDCNRIEENNHVDDTTDDEYDPVEDDRLVDDVTDDEYDDDFYCPLCHSPFWQLVARRIQQSTNRERWRLYILVAFHRFQRRREDF